MPRLCSRKTTPVTRTATPMNNCGVNCGEQRGGRVVAWCPILADQVRKGVQQPEEHAVLEGVDHLERP